MWVLASFLCILHNFQNIVTHTIIEEEMWMRLWSLMMSKLLSLKRGGKTEVLFDWCKIYLYGKLNITNWMSRTIFPMMLKALVLCSVKFCKFLVFLGMNFRQRRELPVHVSDECDAFGGKSLLTTCLWWRQEAQNKQSHSFSLDSDMWCFYAPTGSTKQQSSGVTLTQSPAPGWESSVTVQWTGWWL